MTADLLGLVGLALDAVAVFFLAAVLLVLTVGALHDLIRNPGRGR